MAGVHDSAETGGLHKRGDALLILAVTLLTGTALSAITPAFPAVRAALGISATQVGLLITSYTLPAILLAPVLGIVADRLGRKRVLSWALLLFGLAGGACAFAPGFYALLALRFAQGVFGSVLYSLGVALITAIYQGEHRTQMLSFDSGAAGLGQAVFPLLGGLLAPLSWRYPFALAFLAIPLALVFMWQFELPETAKKVSLKQSLRDLWLQLQRRIVRVNVIITFLLGIVVVGAFYTYLPVTLHSRFGASALLIGVIFAARALGISAVSLLLDDLLQDVGALLLIRLALVLSASALVLIPLLPGVWYLLLPAVMLGVSYGVLLTALGMLLADDTPTPDRGAILSLRSSASALGYTVGPLLMGVIYSVGAGLAVFLTAAGLSTVMLLYSARLVQPKA